jgi:hypothetical protein
MLRVKVKVKVKGFSSEGKYSVVGVAKWAGYNEARGVRRNALKGVKRSRKTLSQPRRIEKGWGTWTLAG